MRYPIAVLVATGLTTAGLTQSPPNPQPAQTSAAPPAAQPPAQPDEVEIIAKRLCKAEPVVGTRLAVKRRCNTPRELAAYQRQAREFIDNYRRRPCMAGAEGGEGHVLPC